jgi:hypothetical protein
VSPDFLKDLFQVILESLLTGRCAIAAGSHASLVTVAGAIKDEVTASSW